MFGAKRTGSSDVASAAKAQPLQITTHDQGALHILSLMKHANGLAHVTKALIPAARQTTFSGQAQILVALRNEQHQLQHLTAQIESVTCSTHRGQTGQRQTIHALQLSAQACSEIASTFNSTDSKALANSLNQAKLTAHNAQVNLRYGVKLLAT